MDTGILGAMVLGKGFTVAEAHAPSLPASRAEAVALARTSGTGLPQLAHDRGLAEQALRGWMKRADSDGGREEPRRLRRALTAT